MGVLKLFPVSTSSTVVAAALVLMGSGCVDPPDPGGDGGTDADLDSADVMSDAPDSDDALDAGPEVQPDVADDASDGSTDIDANPPDALYDVTEDVPEDQQVDGPPDGPPVPNQCGDGWRDLLTEECDDGIDPSSSDDRACSSACTVVDRIAGDDLVTERFLGLGRHPVAGNGEGHAVVLLELSGDAGDESRVAIHTFSPVGVRLGSAMWPEVPFDADPVVAPLPSGGFAIAFGDFSADSDGLGITVVGVSGDAGSSMPATCANETEDFSQHSPDIVWTGSELVVGWEDESTIPRRICTQRFNEQLVKLGDQSCTTESLPVSRVSLASLQGQLIRSWRADGLMTSYRVEMPGGVWGSDLVPSPAFDETIALAEVDTATMLAVFCDGLGEMRAVALDAFGSELGDVLVLNQGGVPRFQPSLASTADGVYLAWREPALPPDSGDEWDPVFDELWLQRLAWDGVMLNVSADPIPLPRIPSHQQGDQARPALVAIPYWPGGAVLAAWDDMVSTGFGAQSEHGDVVLELIPTPVLRTPLAY